MNHDTGKYCTLLIALTCFHVTLFAHENTTKKWNSVKSITGFPAATLVNSNNISAWYQNNGLAENDPLSDAGGVTYPRGTATAIY